MLELKVYRLTFHSGLHVGRQGGNLEDAVDRVSSDTLFAALVDVFCRMGRDPAQFIGPFPRDGAAGDPPFLLSSALPFAGDVLFFPMPLPLQHWFNPGTTLKNRRKQIKRIRYVSKGLLDRMLNGEKMDDWLFPQDENVVRGKGVALQGGKFWLTSDEVGKLPSAMMCLDSKGAMSQSRALRYRDLYWEDKVPRVTVDRISSASDIFHSGRVCFAKNCGLWFGVRWLHPERLVGEPMLSFECAFKQALSLLGEDGLGGERSVGYGAFTHDDPTSLNLPTPVKEGTHSMLLLSRYHPRADEVRTALAGERSAYTLVPQGGWTHAWRGSAQRRRRVWMVAEGSVIQGSGLLGDLVDVRPGDPCAPDAFPHPVWRYGLALGVGIKEVAYA